MKRVLIAPLDWGLGHATRCIPVIKELISRNCDVILAGSGDSLQLLRNEFPGLRSLPLPGYQPVYPTAGSMVWKMARQLPKFIDVIKTEHRQLEHFIQVNNVELVLSDNRFGCWSRQIPSVFMTHQRNILMPDGFRWLANAVNRFNHAMIERFTYCWIPDCPGTSSLAGILTAGVSGERQPRYIGTLSRFTRLGESEKKFDVLVLLSGPEPQRSLFEAIVVGQLQQSGLRYFVVRGIVSSKGSNLHTGGNCADFLSGRELQTVIEESSIVISRSGYSTIMDLARLERKAILVPTPGQTEQEYLASALMAKKVAYSMEQHRFNISLALNESQKYTGFVKAADHSNLLHEALDELLRPVALDRKTGVPLPIERTSR